MKKVDSGEFHNLNQYNDFSEYQPFSAEQYYSTEAQKPPVETQQYDESYENEGGKSVNSEGAESSTDFNDIQKQYDNVNQPDSSGAADSSAPTNANVNATQTASTSSSSAAQAGSVSGSAGGASTAAASASTAAAGASVGATAVAAVVIVSAAVTGGLIANFDSYIGNNLGADYVSITVDMDEILSQSNKTYSLSADNFAIEFTGGETPVNIGLVNGKHSYLITGLQPEKTYSYTITCNSASFGSNSTCYSQTVTTKSVGKGECVYDELNNYVVYDEVTQTASVFYSIYLSDYEKEYANSTFYICSSEQTDLNNINHIIYSDDTLDENNFFKGELNGVIYDELYLYVVAENQTEQGADKAELFTLQLSVNLPEEWKTAKSPAFVVDESAESVTSLPDSIYVGGSLNKLNENYTYYAYVTQYASDGTTLVERQEVGLTVDPANMSYSLNVGAYYGVNKFKYVIYTKDDSGNEITVYESADKSFTASQEYGASYNVIEPINAKYEYTAEKLTITVDPAFTSDSDIYSYKLVIDCNDKVYGEYQGTGVAVFEITDFSDLDYIEFTYTDIGVFADGEHVYAIHSTMFIKFGSIFLDLGTTSITMGDGRIWVGGVIDSLNENFTYSAYVSQYALDGTPLVEREEVTLNINAESMSFWFECATYYEVKKFKYVIYTHDNNGDEVIVYDDGEREFTASQEYSATYTKVAPAEASIKYNENSVIITVDPEFTSKNANEEYKLVVTNSTGEVFGEYQGVGVATISITDCVGLDEINFTYYDIGTFADGEREFAQHTTTPVTGKAYFVVDESAEAATLQPDSITVNGKLSKLNENFTYLAYVAQYAQDGTALVEREEVTLNIDTANMSYSFECGAYYGVNTYKYVIYTNDGTNEITAYESGENEYTASQEYGATYNKVEPADATIEYTAEKITITVDPEFDSTYSIYSYKLVVTNSTGQSYGKYQGTGVASIEITDFAGLDEINFTYYDLGEFADGEHEFAEHTTAGIEFNNIFIDVGVTSFANQPDSITVNGKLNKFNENFTYSAYVVQYAEDGTALVEREEVTLNIDTANMSYSLECGAYYGVKTFKYVIYTNDGTNEIAVYESGENEYTASQEYSATYTKVEPADATIEYTAEKITITVDPEFDSTYSIYSYKLVVTNSTGQSYGEYQGTGVASIEITDFTGLDTINFTYYDLGEFADGEHEFAEHSTEGVAFCMPTLSLGAEPGFNGQYFTLSYTCDMIYDYANASIVISVTNVDGVEVYTKNVDSVAQSGTIILDNYEGEFGSVTVTATLNFKDNQSDGAIHSLELAQANYAMNFSFEVTKVVADVSAYIRETMSVKLNFDHTLPDGYMVKITDDANAIDLTLPLAEMAEGYSINDLDMSVAYNLTIQATDADGNVWGEAKTINISKSAAEAEYTSPIMSCPNPGDALVTYNDDGTINIYREMIPDAYGRDTVSDDERVYYNAVVHVGYYDDSYNFVDTVRYDVIGRGKYAVLENVPKENYTFVYYQMFDFNGVSYVMYTEIPSGTIETVYEDEDGFADFATAAVSVSGGRTTISANISAYGKLDNRIIVNGTEYTYTTYSDESETNPTLVIEGEIDVSEVKVFFTMQGYNYDAYSEKITIKGSKYGEYTITVTTAEA